ncbi:MAG: LamG domain-containing protein [Candidatus Poribacteria bacterium]|nr:LamG domain-containing protein [Candidatus Poribacteria bacterium]
MKKLIIVLTLSVSIIGLYGITDAKNIVTDGLVSYWTFDLHNIKDGIAEDVWGENDATIMGNPEIVGGRVKQALEFDGIKDYVNLTTLSDFGAKLSSSTFEAWIKTDYKDAWTTIFKTLSDGCGNSGIMIWGIDINRTPNKLKGIFEPPFIFGEDVIQLYLSSFFKNQNGCSFSLLKGNFPISDGEWHHLVYTTATHVDENGGDWTERALFIDGTLNEISPYIPIGPKVQHKYVPFSEPVYLGAGNNRGRAEGFFNGIIDEVRIYDRPLTEAEIMHNYQSKTGLAVEHKDKLPTVWGALKARP